MARDKTRDEFAGWMAAPKKTKLAMGLPMRQNEFAELKGVSPRTLLRWKKDPEFQVLVEQKKARFAEGRPPAGVGRPRPYTDARSTSRLQEVLDEAAGDLPVGETPEETQYLRMQAAIVEKAMEGDYRAQELYLKHWGKTFIEAEQSADDELAGLTQAELEDRLLSMIGATRVAAWLSGQA